MKVTCIYREIYFSWCLLALVILNQAKISRAETEIKNKRQKLYNKEKPLVYITDKYIYI